MQYIPALEEPITSVSIAINYCRQSIDTVIAYDDRVSVDFASLFFSNIFRRISLNGLYNLSLRH